MPHERRGHGIEPVEVLVEIGGRKPGNRVRFLPHFFLALGARAIGRPHDGAGQDEQQGARGDDNLTPKRLRAQKSHGSARF